MAYGYEEFKIDVYKLTDINLDMYKERQMKRRIESLIQRKGFDGFESFYKGMKQDKGLLRTFVSYLTINVSQFYRNPAQWENFDKEIVPYLKKNYGNKITIWSAACSTGDEPYTLAMIMAKHVPLSNINIIATDIDEDVLAFAKAGIYTGKSMEDLPECVSFKKHNLLEDKYFDDVSLIVCRNVVIYFTNEAKNEVYAKFHNALAENGILFIGSTEQILKAKELGFDPIKTFFYKKIL